MARTILTLFVIAYLPGAILFRLPVANRARRASLPAEERAYWAVMLSVVITTIVALLLAVAGVYTLERVIICDVALAVLLTLAATGRLRFTERAPRAQWPALIPLALLALGASMYFAMPPAEYIVGGRDPGVYMN